MIRVSCDQCDEAIDRAEPGWYGLDFEAPYEPHPDPVQALNDAEGEMVATLKVGFNSDHAFHFCSIGCLTTWSFSQEMAP